MIKNEILINQIRLRTGIIGKIKANNKQVNKSDLEFEQW